jgi:hypothetical protein
MRFLLIIVLGMLLVACGGQATAQLPPDPHLPTVGELLLTEPSTGQVAALGYLFIDDDGAALVDGLGVVDQPSPLDTTGLWLGVTPLLPSDTLMTVAGEARYLVVEARGLLEGPGAFGPEGRYRYSLSEAELRPQTPRPLSIALLLADSARYEGQAVQIEGQLLATSDSALLVERIGAGGVPDSTALQLKLDAPPRDAALAPRLRQSSDGRVSFGPVEVVGLWRDGRLYPLAVAPR